MNTSQPSKPNQSILLAEMQVQFKLTEVLHQLLEELFNGSGLVHS